MCVCVCVCVCVEEMKEGKIQNLSIFAQQIISAYNVTIFILQHQCYVRNLFDIVILGSGFKLFFDFTLFVNIDNLVGPKLAYDIQTLCKVSCTL